MNLNECSFASDHQCIKLEKWDSKEQDETEAFLFVPGSEKKDNNSSTMLGVCQRMQAQT